MDENEDQRGHGVIISCSTPKHVVIAILVLWTNIYRLVLRMHDG